MKSGNGDLRQDVLIKIYRIVSNKGLKKAPENKPGALIRQADKNYGAEGRICMMNHDIDKLLKSMLV